MAAQKYLGSISGEATDPTGAKVPGAVVTAEEVTTHFKTTATTNAAGAYSFPALNPGTYTVTVSAPSFKSAKRTNLVLTAGQIGEADFTLTIGAATDTVQVTSENALLDTGSANIATTLSTQEVTDLPNEGRNPFVMATLAAGVINGGSGGYFQGKSSQFTNPYSGTAVQIISDGNSGHNRLTLDGIPDDPAERLSGASYLGFVPSPEAVQEVKLQSSIFDAQVGHGNGTVTNTVVRGGTNSLHGSAYYVFENTYLNANTSEKVPNQNLCYPGTPGCTNTVTPTRRNNDQIDQTGFVIDGPVYIPKLYDGRDKFYFMAAYERYQTHTALSYTTHVPTAAEVAGNFAGICPGGFSTTGLCLSGQQLYDPLSPLDANNNRTTFFANNVIPMNRLNNVGLALAALYPLGVPGSESNTSNYISTQTAYPSTYPSFIVRFDQSIGSKDKLNEIFFRSGLTQSYPFEGFPHGIPPMQGTTGYGYSVYRNNRGGSLDEVHEFNSSMVLDSRFGIIFHPFGLVYPGNQNYNLGALNISNTGLPYSSFPGAEITTNAYAGLAPGAGGQISENTFGALEEILSKTWGHHTVRFGFEGNLIRYNVQAPQSGFGNQTTTLLGGFLFDNTFTEQNTSAQVNAQKSGDPFAALLLGTPTSVNYFVNIAYALQQIYIAPFVQDDWRVSTKLTVNLGGRWDYESPFTERYNRMNGAFCTTCVNPLQTTVGGTTLSGGSLNGSETFVSAGNRFEYPRNLHAWQPRLGAVYQATPTTVVRAGFGIVYFNTLESPSVGGFTAATNESYAAGVSQPVYGLNTPFPTGVNLPTGSSLGGLTQVGQNISFVDPQHVQPRSAQYTMNVQQQLPAGIALQVAYVGTRPTRLEVNHNINVLPQQYYNQGASEVTYLNTTVTNPMAGKIPGTPVNGLNGANVARNLLLLPYPEYGTITENDSSIGSAPYNALQIQVSHPMRHHVSLQGNFTWDKVMLRNGFFSNGGGGNPDNASIASGHLYSVQDPNPTILATIFGTYELPKFEKAKSWVRLLVGGWEANGVMRAENGPLVPAPSNVNIIGNVRQSNPTYARYFNTCYENSTGVPVNTSTSTPPLQGCDALSTTPAFMQRLSYTSQTNSNYLNVRERVHPLVDASLFKKFLITKTVSFEIRGEFFNVLNTPVFGAPGTTIASSTFGSVASSTGVLTQANDPRIGQLTARINF